MKEKVVSMAAQNMAPVIIKRKKVISGGGHHGGAWKVAYADFVTAMMAFFMLMWLLNATTEKQRKGLADYFAPTIPIHRVSGGGDGAFGGDNVMAAQDLPQNGVGAATAMLLNGQTFDKSEQQKLEELEKQLTAFTGESMASDLMSRHIITKLSDEGLIVELFATEDEPLFKPNTNEVTPLLSALTEVVAEVFSLAENNVAIAGYTRSHAIVLAQDPSWSLSLGRAASVRATLEGTGFSGERIIRVTGHADHSHAVENPMSVRNDRIELVLLRSKL